MLVLEDLHWSDYSTLELLAFLAQHKEPVRLLVIGTFRPVEVLDTGHRLQAIQQELYSHGRCEELALAGLTVEAIQTYLTARFAGQEPPTALAQELYEWTEGNPLFLVSMVNELVDQGRLSLAYGQHDFRVVLASMGVPRSLQALIDKQLSRLTPDEQRLLAVGQCGPG